MPIISKEIEAAALVSALMETTSEGFWLLDELGQVIAVNKAYEKMSGYMADEMVGLLVNDLDVDAGTPDVAARIVRIQSVGSEIFETRHRRKDGSIFDVEVSGTLLPNSGGKLICLCRDISLRKQAESELKRNTDIQTVLHQIAQAALEANSLQDIYDAVQRLIYKILPAQNFHISLTDESNQQILILYSKNSKWDIPQHRPICNGLTEYAMRLGRAVHLTEPELAQLCWTGEAAATVPGILEWMGTPLQDSSGNLFGVIGLYLVEANLHFKAEDLKVLSIIAAHISQRVEKERIETALRTKETEFRSLIKALPLPMAIINRVGEHTYINERFTQFFGYSYADIPTQDHWQQVAFPDENYRQWVLQDWNAAVEKILNTRTDSAQMEYNVTCKNGTVCSVITSCSRLGNDIIATFTDVSERQRREQLLKNTYERRRKNDLLNELIQVDVPSKRIVRESAQILGAKMMQAFSCFFVKIEAQQGNADPLLLDSLLNALDEGDRVAWDSHDGIGVLWFAFHALEFDKERQKVNADQLRQLIELRAPSVQVYIGISEPAVNLSAIAAHFKQARVSAEIGQKVWPEQNNYHYLDIGIYQLLSDLTNEHRKNEYIDRMLGKLLRYDKRKRAAYLATLELILMSDNLKASADKLSIHYHTLMFRKQRLEQILEVSFEDYAARLAILNALHLLKLRQE